MATNRPDGPKKKKEVRWPVHGVGTFLNGGYVVSLKTATPFGDKSCHYL